MSTAKNSKQAQAKASAPASVKANPARGEVAFSIGDKHLILVPTYANLAPLEEALDMSYADIVIRLAEQSPRFRLSHLVPVILSLNTGDDITDEEIAMWVRDDIQTVVDVVSRVLLAVADPSGTKYTVDAAAPTEGEESPNV